MKELLLWAALIEVTFLAHEPISRNLCAGSYETHPYKISLCFFCIMKHRIVSVVYAGCFIRPISVI